MAAHLTLGNATQLREAHREIRGVPLLEELVRDVRYALRGFRRQPAFTAVAVVTLAIGIGANAAVFSIVHGVLMRPLAYADPDALVSVTRSSPAAPGQASPARWISLRRWESLRDARVVRGRRVSAGVRGCDPRRPRAGRAAGRPHVGQRVWHSRRAADSRASVSRRTRMLTAVHRSRSSASGCGPGDSGRDPSIVGHDDHAGFGAAYRHRHPAGRLSLSRQGHRLWLSAACDYGLHRPPVLAVLHPLMGVARIRPGVTRQQADAEITVLNARYEPAGPAARRRWCGRLHAAQGRSRRTRAHHAVDADGRGRVRAAHRVRERRDAVDGARDVPDEGVCPAYRAGCRPGPPRASTRDRESAALGERRRARPRHRLCRCARGSDDDAVRSAARITSSASTEPCCCGRWRSRAPRACCSERSRRCSC